MDLLNIAFKAHKQIEIYYDVWLYDSYIQVLSVDMLLFLISS